MIRRCFQLLVLCGVLRSLTAGAGAIPVEESVVFYQFSDRDGVIHFVDSLEKVPVRYRSKVSVRTDTPSARQTTRVLVEENQIHVPVTFTHGDRTVSALMLLDTGASQTVITEAMAGRLGIDPAGSRPATTRLADGRTVDLRIVRIDGMAVGTRSRAPVEIGIMQHLGDPELHDGLLGLDFLGEFQYQIDLPNRLIRWQ